MASGSRSTPLSTLQSCLSVLTSAESVASTAAAVPFSRREQREPFTVREVNAREVSRPASKVEQAGIADNAKPQQILAALREVADDSEREQVFRRSEASSFPCLVVLPLAFSGAARF